MENATELIQTWWLVPPSRGSSPRPARRDALARLDRLGGELDRCESGAERTKAFLHAVRDSLEADAAFVWSASAGEPFRLVGNRDLPAGWCGDLVRDLLEQSPGTDSQLLRAAVRGLRVGGEAPATVAMVRLSRTYQSWAVALGFDPSRRFVSADVNALAVACRLLRAHRQQAALQGRLTETIQGLFRGFVTAIDAKDGYTRGHSERVARLAVRLGQQLRLPADVLSDLWLAGLIHNIGYAGVPDTVLRRPGPLAPGEAVALRGHTVLGDRVVAGLPSLRHLRPGVRSHHERYDGAGYPDGLAGEQIPLLARVIAVADAYDAMRSDRPHRLALPLAQVVEEFVAGAGSQWDPRVVTACLACRAELDALRAQALPAEGAL